MSNFTYILSFEFTFSVKLSNITILGNDDIVGCSSIISQRSIVDISNSMFVGINGYFGAALTVSESLITMARNNSFSKNIARLGGAMFVHNSTVLFSGNNSFVENSAPNQKSLFIGTCKHYYDFISLLQSGSGGAIYCVNSNLSNNDCSTIITKNVKNKTLSVGVGGQSNQSCLHNYNISYLLFLDNSASTELDPSFALGGAALFIEKSVVSFNDRVNMYYSNNSAPYGGGVIQLTGSSMQLCGNVSLISNSARFGGAIYIDSSNISFGFNCRSHNLYCRNNSASTSGGAIQLFASSMQLCGNVLLISNSARFGGAIDIDSSNISFGLNCSAHNLYCRNNSASYSGGAVRLFESSMQFCGNVSLINNSAFIGGAIRSYFSNISFGQNCSTHNMYYKNNSAIYDSGGAIKLTGSSMQLCGNVSLINNSADLDGAIDTDSSNISFGLNYSTNNIFSAAVTCKISFVFELNRAISLGGAVASHRDHLYFNGDICFHENKASYGGAISLESDSKLILIPFLSIRFVKNTASMLGGAIHFNFYNHDSVSYCERKQKRDNQCFISFLNSLENISLIFEDNSAVLGGEVLYVQQTHNCNTDNTGHSVLDKCKSKIGLKNDSHSNLFNVLMNVSKIITENNQTSLLGDAENITLCNSQEDYHSNSHSVYPGQNFNVVLIAVGPASLNAKTKISHKSITDQDTIILTQVNCSIHLKTKCTNVSYFVKATTIKTKSTVKYKLYHRNPCDSLVEGVSLTIDVKPCPLGFQLSGKEEICVCDERLQTFTQNCDINRLSIERKENTYWISNEANDSILILHEDGCPFDFCKDKLINVPLSNPDEQCNNNRVGTLCGQCKANYSLALGTLHCIKCTNSNYIALILPFALAGIVLVIVILLLHLTVDVGTLNGLIFYVNIIHTNHQAFLSYHARERNILTVFIAWLNLDFGIETCFYDGMDIYTYSWLQFVFPFYIWFLIGAIIFVSHYSKRVSKSLGQNPVAALATLLFVSYGKILNAIITPLSLTHLTLYSSDDSSSTYSVWLYDGSIDYFKDTKHIVLGLFAISILLVVFLPYTFLLLCGHWLMVYSDKCFLSWLNRIKPFMDVYYAPFKKEGRYWIGLILLSRLALLLTIAINAVGSDSVNHDFGDSFSYCWSFIYQEKSV